MRITVLQEDGAEFETTLDEFLFENEGIDAGPLDITRSLAVSGSYVGGGGASPAWELRRVEEELAS